MIWFFLSLVVALSVALRDVSIKTYEDFQPLEIAALELFWALPLLVIGCIIVETPPLDQTFWWTFILSIPINIMAYILYLYAIKFSPISLSVKGRILIIDLILLIDCNASLLCVSLLTI